jgi:hypothetical protein
VPRGTHRDSHRSVVALVQWDWAGQNYRTPFSKNKKTKHNAEGAREPPKQVWLWSRPSQVPVLSFALCTSPLLKHPPSPHPPPPHPPPPHPPAQEEEAGAPSFTLRSGARVSRPAGDESPRAANAILRSAKDTAALVSALAPLAASLLPSLAPKDKHC